MKISTILASILVIILVGFTQAIIEHPNKARVVKAEMPVKNKKI